MNHDREFSDWFGGSQIVDKFGNPLRVYHGSVNSGFTTFKTMTPVRPRTGPDGFYFTSDKNAAANYQYDRERKSRGELITAYLSIWNPLDITKDVKKFQKAKMTFGAAKAKALEKLGPEHDGVRFAGNNLNPDDIIALRPEQIWIVR